MRLDIVDRKIKFLVVLGFLLIIGGVVAIVATDYIDLATLNPFTKETTSTISEPEKKEEIVEEPEPTPTESDTEQEEKQEEEPVQDTQAEITPEQQIELDELPNVECFDKSNYLTFCKQLYDDALCDLKVKTECAELEKEVEELDNDLEDISAGELFGRGDSINAVKAYKGTDGTGPTLEESFKTVAALTYPDLSYKSLLIYSPVNGWRSEREGGTQPDSVYLVHLRIKTNKEDTTYTWRYDLEERSIESLNEEAKSVLDLVNTT